MTASTLDVSAYVGLTAVGAVTLNMLMAIRYSPVRSWPHRKFNYFRLHNWCGYIALSASAVHPVILLFNKGPKFRVADLIYTIHSPSQPLENTVGAIALYLNWFGSYYFLLQASTRSQTLEGFPLLHLFCGGSTLLS